jgi:hypothetical protein
MFPEEEYFRNLSQRELWQRYCGFLDLSIERFMAIQTELLLDQIERVSNSTIGKKIMNNSKPISVEDFRRSVPLTTYDDYEPYLSERQEDALGEKPITWCHSSGRGGSFKWIPYTSVFMNNLIKRILSVLILAATKEKGRINISPSLRLLSITPPEPYASGYVLKNLDQYIPLRLIPPARVVENMEFQDRIRKGFELALRDGVDIIAAIASILVRMGEEITGQAHGVKLTAGMLHPKVLSRLLRAYIRSKIEKRALLPKDIWPVKGILAAGMDAAIYKDDIAYYWGTQLYEIYGGTESFLISIQDWGRRGMVFLPDLVFLEFIPYEEQLESKPDKGYKLATVLLSEVEEGKSYELVVTQLYGMPLLRYRLRDIIKVISLKDEEAGVNLPHIIFQHRAGEVINLGGLCWLDEKSIWQAIINTGIKYTEWSACKEYHHNQSFLRIYLELKEHKEPSELEVLIDEQLKIVDTDYKDIGSYLNLQPVRVTLLPPGTFQRYVTQKMKEGADLAHLKPAHMNPSETIIQQLIKLSEVG